MWVDFIILILFAGAEWLDEKISGILFLALPPALLLIIPLWWVFGLILDIRIKASLTAWLALTLSFGLSLFLAFVSSVPWEYGLVWASVSGLSASQGRGWMWAGCLFSVTLLSACYPSVGWTFGVIFAWSLGWLVRFLSNFWQTRSHSQEESLNLRV